MSRSPDLDPDAGGSVARGPRLAVVGSRTFSDRAMMREAIESAAPSVVVSGGADGADTLAREIGIELGLPVEEFLPDWEAHGPEAGFRRNQQIVDHSEAMIAFFAPGPETPGTVDLIERADRKGIPVSVHRQAPEA